MAYVFTNREALRDHHTDLKQKAATIKALLSIMGDTPDSVTVNKTIRAVKDELKRMERIKDYIAEVHY